MRYRKGSPPPLITSGSLSTWLSIRFQHSSLSRIIRSISCLHSSIRSGGGGGSRFCLGRTHSTFDPLPGVSDSAPHLLASAINGFAGDYLLITTSSLLSRLPQPQASGMPSLLSQGWRFSFPPWLISSECSRLALCNGLCRLLRCGGYAWKRLSISSVLRLSSWVII